MSTPVTKARASGPPPPIAVDLDGTLLLVDTLHEGLVELLKHKPWLIFALLFTLLKGKAAFKAYVTRYGPIDVHALPVRTQLLDYLGEQRRQGRRLGLFSAADQSIVDACSARFGIFDVSVGSQPHRNLSGRTKLDVIREHFGQTFVYAGDASVDLPIWKEADAAIYVGRSAGLRARVERATELEHSFDAGRAPLSRWMFAMRIHQWPKNALVFVPAVLSIPLLSVTTAAQFVLAFLTLCAVASATYLLNDLVDVGADRAHRYKSNRPFASGEISLLHGVALALLVAAAGIALAAALPLRATLLIATYAATSLAYSFVLKRQPILDVIILGFLFTVRIAIGASILVNATPYWLYAFSMFFFTSLALVKRQAELQVAVKEGKGMLLGREYRPVDLPLVQGAGIGCALSSIVVFLIYLGDQQFDRELFRNAEWLGLAPAALAFWILRIWLLTLRGQMHDDPVIFALRDRTSYVAGLVVGLALFLAW